MEAIWKFAEKAELEDMSWKRRTSGHPVLEVSASRGQLLPGVRPLLWPGPRLLYAPFFAPPPGAAAESPARAKGAAAASRESTAALKAWLGRHPRNPYPSKGEKVLLALASRLSLTQVSTWFANARRRLKKEGRAAAAAAAAAAAWAPSPSPRIWRVAELATAEGGAGARGPSGEPRQGRGGLRRRVCAGDAGPGSGARAHVGGAPDSGSGLCRGATDDESSPDGSPASPRQNGRAARPRPPK